jgi:hypothetical protein
MIKKIIPLTDIEIDELIKKMIKNRVKDDYKLSKKINLFGKQGPQYLNIKTGPWTLKGPYKQ